MPRILSVASGKGGVGKTNISVNLALLLNDLGLRTCLLDADAGLANADVILGVHPEKTLEDVVFGRSSLRDVILTTEDGLDLIPGVSGMERMADLTRERLETAVARLSDLAGYDCLILDCSSGIGPQTLRFCRAASEVLLVFTPEPTSLVDAFALLKVLSTNNPGLRLRAVLNDCPSKKIAKAAFHNLRRTASNYLDFDLQPAGVIMRDPRVAEAVQNRRPLVRAFPHCPAARSLMLTARLIARPAEAREKVQTLADFWARFFRPGETRVDQERVEVRPDPKSLSSPGRKSERTPCPQVLLTLLRILKHEPNWAEGVGRVAALDPAATIHLLTQARVSPPPGDAGGFNLTRAATFIGRNRLKNLFGRLAAIYALTSFSEADLLKNRHGFLASLDCALISEALAHRLDLPPSEAWPAGLLQGQSNNKTGWSESGKNDPIISSPPAASELEDLGLPSLVVDAIRYAHEPPDRIRQALPLVRLVHAARRLSERGLPSPGSGEPIEPAWKRKVTARKKRLMDLIGMPEQTPSPGQWETLRQELAAEVKELLFEMDSLLAVAETDEFAAAARAQSLAVSSELGPCGLVFFSFLPEKRVLKAVYHEAGYPSELLANLTLPADRGQSLPTRAFRESRPLFSLGRPKNKKLELIDEQLRRILGRDALACFPLNRGNEKTGLMLIGCDPDQARRAADPSFKRRLDRSAPFLARSLDESRRPAEPSRS